MTDLYIPREVVDKDGRRAVVVSIAVVPRGASEQNTPHHDIKLENFLETYTEYVDPKDLEIARLLKELADLKLKYKPTRKSRKKLTRGEVGEIQELIRKGEGNTPIGTEYDISDSAISKIRVQMRKAGENV